MALGLPVILLGIWWVASAGSESFFFPPLSEILATFPATWFEGRITAEVLPSLYRLVAGYLIALVVGVAAGTAIGLSPRLRALTEPTLEFFRAIPPPVMIPIIMLFLGIFTSMKIFVIATGALWPILLNTIEGVRGIDDVLRDTSRVYRLRPATRLRTLVLRGASPQIVTGARQALSIAIILMVISEMFAASNGLGFTIVQFQRSFAIPEMWTGIILLGLLGFLLSLIFRALERPVLAWYTGLRQSQRGGN
ncbi:ABC transporter permease subunit [Georgenia yuyongxinii]|nr:ABC transporter permease subunit [Georgenia yuyongxinii]